MLDLSVYIGTWYKTLIMFLLLIFGGAAANYLIFSGPYLTHLGSSSTVAFVVAIVAYFQKRRNQKGVKND